MSSTSLNLSILVLIINLLHINGHNGKVLNFLIFLKNDFFLADVVVHDPGGDVKQVFKYHKIILDWGRDFVFYFVIAGLDLGGRSPRITSQDPR